MAIRIDTMIVVPSDKFISINDEGYAPCEFECKSPYPQYGEVHAIQWFGGHGHIEHLRGPAVGFPEKSETGGPDKSMLDAFVPAWRKTRAKALRERHAMTVRHRDGTAEFILTARDTETAMEQQLAELDKHLVELAADDASRGATENSRARIANQLGRLRSELELHERNCAQLEEAAKSTETAAVLAEAEAI